VRELAQVERRIRLRTHRAVVAVKAKTALLRKVGEVAAQALPVIGIERVAPIAHLVLIVVRARLHCQIPAADGGWGVPVARRPAIAPGACGLVLVVQCYSPPAVARVAPGLILNSCLARTRRIAHDPYVVVSQGSVGQGDWRAVQTATEKPQAVIAQVHRSPGAVVDLDAQLVWVGGPLVIHILGDDQAGQVR